MRLLVLRPEPGASATARRIAVLGHEAIVAPLFVVSPIVWQAPDRADYDALVLTSANAVRHAGPALAMLAGLPVYAVGSTTAAAAWEAGLSVRVTGTSDAAELLQRAVAEGVRRPLHLAGADHRTVVHDGCDLRRIIVYRADPVSSLPDAAKEALASSAVALLHSPRAAALFASLLTDELPRSSVSIAAISAATAQAAGEGWRSTSIAALPTDDALLAAALLLCKTEAGTQDRAGV